MRDRPARRPRKRGDSDEAACRGRPRDPEADAAILRAALRRMAKDGYSRMSVDAVAADAGVTKPTVYRRWATKADLATAALAQLQAEEAPPVGDSPRDDLREALRAFAASLLRPNGMAMIGTLLVEERHTPKLLALFRDRILAPRRAALRAILERAQSQGRVRADADLDAAVNMLVGAFYARYLTGQGVPRDWPDRVVETLWAGVGRG